jgi:hypothetical protein
LRSLQIGLSLRSQLLAPAQRIRKPKLSKKKPELGVVNLGHPTLGTRDQGTQRNQRFDFFFSVFFFLGWRAGQEKKPFAKQRKTPTQPISQPISQPFTQTIVQKKPFEEPSA